jgi:hypothetical protein
VGGGGGGGGGGGEWRGAGLGDGGGERPRGSGECCLEMVATEALVPGSCSAWAGVCMHDDLDDDLSY